MRLRLSRIDTCLIRADTFLNIQQGFLLRFLCSLMNDNLMRAD